MDVTVFIRLYQEIGINDEMGCGGHQFWIKLESGNRLLNRFWLQNNVRINGEDQFASTASQSHVDSRGLALVSALNQGHNSAKLAGRDNPVVEADMAIPMSVAIDMSIHHILGAVGRTVVYDDYLDEMVGISLCF